MRTPLAAAVLLALLLPMSPSVADSPGAAEPGSGAATDQARQQRPGFVVTKRVRGLDNPWDVKPIGGGRLLITERDGAHLLVAGPGGKRQVRFPSSSVWRSGETGLMGLEVDPGFAGNRRFYTCQGGFRSGGRHDVRVIAWRLSDGARRATKVTTLLDHLPATSGRHGGCRLLIARNGSLLVGTGDAAVGTNARDRDSLGGKTLRIDRRTGKPWPGNPFADATGKRRYVYTYGHRNVQGLAQRNDGTLWSVEHGSYRDDEVNLLRKGGDYGWNPVPGYDESVPMTDFSLPGRQYGARWRSGNPTLATSGASFVTGKRWGALRGTLAVGVLKSERVLFLEFGEKGRLRSARAPAALRGYGRLRSVTSTVNGNLLITTDSVPGGDAVLQVTPR